MQIQKMRKQKRWAPEGEGRGEWAYQQSVR